MNKPEITLLSEGQIWETKREAQLEVIRKYGTQAEITDLCILTGCRSVKDPFVYRKERDITGDIIRSERTGPYLSKSKIDFNHLVVVNQFGNKCSCNIGIANCMIRPVLKFSENFYKITQNRIKGYNGTYEVEYGEYPQNAVNYKTGRELELKYNTHSEITETGRSYTFNFLPSHYMNMEFEPATYKEYEYQSRRYIRIKANFWFEDKKVILNDLIYGNLNESSEHYVWVEVSPVRWLIDDETGLLIAKKGLASGVRFCDAKQEFDGDFDKTEMKFFLDTYMLPDLIRPIIVSHTHEENVNTNNAYVLDFTPVSEKKIIKGAIENDLPVFLYGSSPEEKSSTVKGIDPTCEIVCLRNATSDSINGKNVYNEQIGEMIDFPPTWFEKLREKCEKEPKKFHVLFFDGITNAPSNIQGMIANIILDKEVNGIWKLPENARIVVSGNDIKDSFENKQLTELLFDRFVYVYVKTTPENWLDWASKHNIHPAIYTYIAAMEGIKLIDEYTGQELTPRKWEMASKMLYKERNPEVLKSLLGENIAKKFTKFCRLPVITLNDVINDNYDEKDIQALNIYEKKVTMLGLTQVDDENLEKVRKFVNNLGESFLDIFDDLWTHGDETRLKRITKTQKRVRKK